MQKFKVFHKITQPNPEQNSNTFQENTVRQTCFKGHTQTIKFDTHTTLLMIKGQALSRTTTLLKEIQLDKHVSRDIATQTINLIRNTTSE